MLAAANRKIVEVRDLLLTGRQSRFSQFVQALIYSQGSSYNLNQAYMMGYTLKTYFLPARSRETMVVLEILQAMFVSIAFF